MRLVPGLLALVTFANAAPQEFVSATSRTHLLELFTSEGCSSCPPAEAWLGQLRTQPGLWREFVPLAWHVDYWDRLGWKDRFASREATQRQQAYASKWNSESVYTPCFVLDGREWRERGRAPAASHENAGVLRASYEGRQLRVEYRSSPALEFEAHAVVLAMGIASKVTRGENRGRELHHEFVVAARPQHARLRDGTAALSLPLPDRAGANPLALAVWITRRGELAAVQATGGLIERNGDE